jgi:hypothetical protein
MDGYHHRYEDLLPICVRLHPIEETAFRRMIEVYASKHRNDVFTGPGQAYVDIASRLRMRKYPGAVAAVFEEFFFWFETGLKQYTLTCPFIDAKISRKKGG